MKFESKYVQFSHNKMHLKMSSVTQRPFCLCLNVFRYSTCKKLVFSAKLDECLLECNQNLDKHWQRVCIVLRSTTCTVSLRIHDKIPDSNVGWLNVGTIILTSGQQWPSLHCLSCYNKVRVPLTHLPLDKMAAISHTIFSDHFLEWRVLYFD